jgi:hypothetical protein
LGENEIEDNANTDDEKQSHAAKEHREGPEEEAAPALPVTRGKMVRRPVRTVVLGHSLFSLVE